MGAGRKKGKWLGGPPILGYDIDSVNHKLLINQKEMPLVSEIFALYLEKKSLLKTTIELNNRGHRTKQFTSRAGIKHGGFKFTISSLKLVLKNPLYIGKIHYDGALYQGLHEAIISEDIFKKVEDLLKDNRVERLRWKNRKFQGLLNHILRCKVCDSIIFHTYSCRGDRRWRYYVCMNSQKRGDKNCPNRSINAQSIEDAVVDSLKNMERDDALRKAVLSEANFKEERISDHELKVALLVNSPIWEALVAQEKHNVLRLLLKDVFYNKETEKLQLVLNPGGIKLLYRMQEGLPNNG